MHLYVSMYASIAHSFTIASVLYRFVNECITPVSIISNLLNAKLLNIVLNLINPSTENLIRVIGNTNQVSHQKAPLKVFE